MEIYNDFISEADRKKFKVGAKDVKDPVTKKVKVKNTISGQSYAEKHGIDSIKMVVFSAKKAMQDMVEVAEYASEELIESTMEVLDQLKGLMELFQEEKVEIAKKKMADKGAKKLNDLAGRELTSEELEAISAIINK